MGKFSDWNTKLESGETIILERNNRIYTSDIQEKLDIALEKSNLEKETRIAELEEQESDLFNKLKEELKAWDDIAEELKVLRLAKEYEQQCKAIEEWEVNNQWEKTENWNNVEFTIQNKTYDFWIRIYENTKYVEGKNIPCSWEVSYNLGVGKLPNISPYNSNFKSIQVVNKKKFTDKDKAYKYVEGRRKYYEKYYFNEIQPPIDKEYEHLFMCNGKLLRGYKVNE